MTREREIEQAKKWRQTNWYDSVPPLLDEALAAYGQEKFEAGERLGREEIEESGYPALVEQLCRNLNEAHDEIMKLQHCADPQKYDWPEWTPQANSIRWAEEMLGKKLAKTTAWTLFPD